MVVRGTSFKSAATYGTLGGGSGEPPRAEGSQASAQRRRTRLRGLLLFPQHAKVDPAANFAAAMPPEPRNRQTMHPTNHNQTDNSPPSATAADQPGNGNAAALSTDAHNSFANAHLFSTRQITAAALFGSVLAGAHLVAANWRTLGRTSKARRTWFVAIPVFCALVFVLGTSEELQTTGFAMVPILGCAIAMQLADKQAPTAKAARERSAKAASNWAVVGITLCYVIGLLVVDAVLTGRNPIGAIWSPEPHASDFQSWTQGARHPQRPNITAATERGRWIPDPGYTFVRPPNLTVRWTPGQKHPSYPHIRSAQQRDAWQADPGYTFPDQQSLQVQWMPGLAHPTTPGAVSGASEGQWEQSSEAQRRDGR